MRKIVNIYRFALNFWAVKADIEREGDLSVSLSNVVRKAKSLLFVRYSNIVSIQNNHSVALFQNQALIGAKEVLSVLVLFARQLMLYSPRGDSGRAWESEGSDSSKKLTTQARDFG